MPEFAQPADGNTERCINVSAATTAGIRVHGMYPQMASEAGTPGCVLRQVTAQGGEDGETGGLPLWLTLYLERRKQMRIITILAAVIGSLIAGVSSAENHEDIRASIAQGVRESYQGRSDLPDGIAFQEFLKLIRTVGRK